MFSGRKGCDRMINEIPTPYVRANQTGIVTVVLLAAITQQPLLIAMLWAIEVAGLVFGQKGNLFIRVAKPFLKKYIATASTEARELNRFNNTLAVIFLTISIICFALGWSVAAFISAGLLALAALGGILGHCLGCFLYFQYKMFKLRVAIKLG